MNKINRVFLFSLLIISSLSFTNKNLSNCSILHEGTFIYPEYNDGKIIIKGNSHIEIYKKIVIQSKIVWESECDFKLIVLKTSTPNKNFKKGSILKVHIDNVIDNDIYYTSTYEGIEIKSILRKVINP